VSAHTAVAVAGLGNDTVVAAVLDNWRTAPVSEKMRSTLGFLEKLTTAPATVEAGDLEPMRLAGVSDKAIEEAIYVCFLFSVMDRLADAFGFELHSAQDFKKGGQVLYSMGYGRLSIPG
jgi:alkylhydroperoxidase family enzyme